MDKILLIDRQNNKWIFNCDGKGRLCYSKNGENEQILLNNAKEDFDIITDNDGNFHLVLQTADANLVCLIYDFENWKKYIILQSRTDKNCMSKFKLFYHNGKTHCFYLFKSGEKTMLVHHIFSPSNPSSTPEVISYADPSKDFSCCMESDGSIHIFYFNENAVFQYKIFSSNRYEDRSLPVEDNIRSICSIYGNGIHLLYTAKMKSYYTLVYYGLNAKERKIISFGDSNISACCIYTHENNIFVQWRERTRCYQCHSNDSGTTFKKPSFIAESRNKHTEPIRIRSKINPRCTNSDRCIAISGNGSLDILNAEQCIGTRTAVNINNKNHITDKNDYNIIDGAFSDEIKMMQSKIRENEKELIRLNTIINTLSDKLSNITKPVNTPAEKPAKTTLDENKIGEINKENYELFKKTDIEDIDSDNSITF
ncbi:MAG: hypothetical protein IJN62_05365 [Clostridia bacterium]|nr:hypothetical protein [Clostridia bacterium]